MILVRMARWTEDLTLLLAPGVMLVSESVRFDRGRRRERGNWDTYSFLNIL